MFCYPCRMFCISSNNDQDMPTLKGLHKCKKFVDKMDMHEDSDTHKDCKAAEMV